MPDPALDTRPPGAPSRRESTTPVLHLAAAAVDALLDKKAQEVRVIDLRKIEGVAEVLVLASGSTDIQVRALTEAVREGVRERHDEKPWRNEGTEDNRWVVLDYVDLVVHLFQPERRAFYGLERLWGDAPYEDVPAEADSSADVALLREAT
jgi:ribosome-associated protein